MTRFILAIFLIVHVQSSYSQNLNPYFDEVSRIYGYVYAINQDKAGYLWVGTRAGLYKHDGTHYQVIDAPDSSLSKQGNYVQAITVDSKDRIWLGTKNGLKRLNPSRTSITAIGFSDAKSQLSHQEIRKVVECPGQEKYWIATYGGGLNQFDENSNKLTEFSKKKGTLNFPGDNVNDIFLDSKNRLWVGSEVGGLAYFKNNKFKRIPTFNNDDRYTVTAIFEDSDNKIWVGTWTKGLFFFDENEQILKQAYRHEIEDDPQNTIRRIISYDDKHLCLATLGGIALFNRQTSVINFYSYNQNVKGSISGNAIWSIFKDRENILWVGTMMKGLCKWDRAAHVFAPFHSGPEEFAPPKDALTALKLIDDKLWLATREGGVHILDTRTWQYLDNTEFELLSGHVVHDICKDAAGSIWMVSDFGIFRYQSNRQLDLFPKRLFIVNGEEMGGTYSCDLGTDGVLYIAGWGTGLMTLSVENQKKSTLHQNDFHHYTTSNSGIPTDIVWQVKSDKNGSIWINSREGLVHFDELNKEFEHPSKEHFYLVSRRNQMYGLGTSFQIFSLSNREATALFKSTDQRVEMFEIDSDENYWLSSRNELVVMSANGSKVLRRFNTKNGLPDEPLHEFLNLKDQSKLALGTSDGLMILNYKDLNLPRISADIKLHHLKVLDKSVVENNPMGAEVSEFLTDEISWSHNENSLEFSFSPMSLSRTRSETIEYKLNTESFWHQVSKSNPVAKYPQLTSGKYTLLVRSINSNGTVSESKELLRFEILPPWWMTWWAIVIYCVVALILIRLLFTYSLVSIKTRNRIKLEALEVEKQEEILDSKMKFFTNVSHEFKTPLTLILGPVRELIKTPDSKLRKQNLETIEKNAEQLDVLVKELLEFRRIESGLARLNLTRIDLLALIRSSVDSFSELARLRNISVEVQSNQEELILMLDEYKVRTVFQNLLSNAFKFTDQNGNIELKIHSDDQAIKVKVTDSGTGIKESILDKVFDRFVTDKYSSENSGGTGIGLALVKQIVGLHGGTIKAYNVENGACFELTLPILEDSGDEEVFTVDVAKEEPSDSHDPSLLIVEDNEEIRAFITSVLEGDFQILTASNGLEGLKLAEKYQPNIVLSDIMMPVMDGLELCKKIKSDINTSHIPVILLTARSEQANELEGLEVQANDYITKPFDSNVLKQKLLNIISGQQALKRKLLLDETTKLDDDQLTSLDDELMKKVLEVINSRLDDDSFSVDHLSDEIGMSKSHFSRKISALTGVGPAEYIKQVRLNKARELLKTGRFNVSEVSDQVGFSNSRYFATAFKQRFGITPSEVGRDS